MKLAHAQAIVEELNEIEDDVATVHEDYSGRYMYGRTTAGVVTRYPEDVFYAAKVLGLRVRRGDTSTDNMGRDYVVY